jgi:hypothetical protein
MKKPSAKAVRMAPLQRLTVRRIDDPAEQAALDALLARREASASAQQSEVQAAKKNSKRKGKKE